MIRIGAGLWNTLPLEWTRKWRGSQVFIITDSTVKKLYGRRLLRELLLKNVDAWLIDFPAGEASKDADVINTLHTQLLEHGIRRDDLIVALGGGVVGDVAGYVAATVLRGVRYIQVPTTLLAQVDSSVGGKVGINHPLGKNLIGAFYHPSAVYIDPEVLRTLPLGEFRSGLAEVVKIAAALDASFFRFLEKNASRINRKDKQVLTEVISRSIRLKAEVVEKDEREAGLRKTLNLGHTIAHALEVALGYTLRHGEAVAVGLVAEAKIAVEMGLLSRREQERLLQLMKALKLRTSFPRLRSKAKFFDALAADKKAVGEFTKFVLLKRIGYSVVGVDVPTPFIEEVIS